MPAVIERFLESAGDPRARIADAERSIQEPARVPVWQGREEGDLDAARLVTVISAPPGL